MLPRLTALLSLGSIVTGVGSSTPSSVPASAYASDYIVASEHAPNILTIYNDGRTHTINNAYLFNPGTIAVTAYATLRIEDGYVKAPDNGYKLDTEWPAIRLSIGSTLNATGGTVTGALAMRDGTDGGEAIEIYNGQAGPITASHAHFYDGMDVVGGDSQRNGQGGNALHVHGFGTSVFVHGGKFKGGKGADGDDGLSIYTSNGGNVYIYSGTFEGEMEVGDSSVIAFYGCFMQNGTVVSGVFADETNLEVNVRAENGGEVVLIPVSDQECETAPSTAPSPFPTLSPQPTVPRPNDGSNIAVTYGFTIMAASTLLHFILVAVPWQTIPVVT
mmetsp:Transcript_21077/g.45122  ORF Transcript_21077/g.45122 Transcript_21077/m.45122 type:complete len:331 (-) Transcript_21077:88-1080(-)